MSEHPSIYCRFLALVWFAFLHQKQLNSQIFSGLFARYYYYTIWSPIVIFRLAVLFRCFLNCVTQNAAQLRTQNLMINEIQFHIEP